jgi:hypothetical protein
MASLALAAKLETPAETYFASVLKKRATFSGALAASNLTEIAPDDG